MLSMKWAHCFRFEQLFLFLTDAKLKHTHIRILKLCNARNRGIAHCSHSKSEEQQQQQQYAIIVISLWMFRNHRYCARLCLSFDGLSNEHSSLRVISENVQSAPLPISNAVLISLHKIGNPLPNDALFGFVLNIDLYSTGDRFGRCVIIHQFRRNVFKKD